jgi:hypothetical protein
MKKSVKVAKPVIKKRPELVDSVKELGLDFLDGLKKGLNPRKK